MDPVLSAMLVTELKEKLVLWMSNKIIILSVPSGKETFAFFAQPLPISVQTAFVSNPILYA